MSSRPGNNVCRVCLARVDDGIPLSQVFNQKFGTLAQMLAFCTGTSVNLDRSLPNLVCHECALKITCFYKFKRNYLTTTERSFQQPVAGIVSSTVEISLQPKQSQTFLVPFAPAGAAGNDDPYNLLEEERNVNVQLNYTCEEVIYVPETDSEDTFSNPDIKLANIKQENASQIGERTIEHSMLSIPMSQLNIATDDESSSVQRGRGETIPGVIEEGHQQSNRFECPCCSETFEEYASLKDHIRTHGTTTCKLCERTIKGNGNIAQHYNSHFKSQPKSKPKQSSFARYMRRVQVQASYQVQQPQQPVASCSGAGTNSYETGYVCPICGLHFSRDSARKNHMRSHENTLSPVQEEQPTNVQFDCYVCDEAFSQKSVQREHINNGHENHECKKCKTQFSKGKNLINHYENYHPNGRWNGYFECAHCDKKFAGLRSVINHQKGCKKRLSVNYPVPPYRRQ